VALTVYPPTRMLANAYSIFVCVVGVIGIGWIVWMMRDSDRDRVDEDDARTFFDEHGRWPDESPEEAEAERRRVAAAAASASAASSAVSRPSSDGLV
jgi:hypothetical protein